MIAIVFIGDLKYCPYLSLYERELKKGNYEYEVLYWSREGKKSSNNNYISYNYQSKLDSTNIMKLKGFYKFRKWLLSRMKNKKYKKIILLSTLSGIIIHDFLIKNYKNKYLLDIRDYSYESNRLFKFIESKVIKNSFITGVSSRGFLRFLPESDKYFIVHNHNENQAVEKTWEKKKTGTVNIVWMGALRYFEHQKKLIDALKNDNRFTLYYHGSGSDFEKYKMYVNNLDANNIYITGEYDNENKKSLLKNADILNNNYHNQNQMETKYAISNKFYDSIYYAIPQLVETETYKSKITEEYQLGFSLDFNNENLGDEILMLYNQLSESKFNNNIKKLSKSVNRENNKYLEQINSFLDI